MNQLKSEPTTLKSVEKYSLASRFFHWVSAVLLLLTWVMYVMHEQATSKEAVGMYMAYHKALGVSLGLFVLARIINRMVTHTPAPLPMPKWQHYISVATHWLLYILLLAQPLAGVLMSMYAGREISMFGIFDIPVLVEPDKELAGTFNKLHTSVFWPMLWIFTLLHIIGALYHQFVMKDGIISRMK